MRMIFFNLYVSFLSMSARSPVQNESTHPDSAEFNFLVSTMGNVS